MKTDEEYINTIKLRYKKRKKAGVSLIFLTLFLIAMTYLAYTKTNESSQLILETLQFQKEGETVKAQDIKDIHFTNKLAHALGIKAGALLGSSVTLIGVFISQTIIMLFGMRKERLLIKYYDLSKKTNK